MKKLSLILTVLLMGALSMSAKGLLVPEIVAGMNVASYNQDGASSRIGFHVGVRGDYYVTGSQEGFYFNAGLMLSLKGCEVEVIKGDDEWWGFDSKKSSLNPFYLDIPIHVGYKYSVTDNIGIFADFGPYFSFGLFGKTEGESVFGDDGLKRFDVGLGLRGGVEFNKKFNVSLGYDWGLVDVVDNGNLKNRNFMVSLGYKF